MTYKEIRANEEVNALLDKGNKNLGLLGFTDHSQAHCIHVADTAGHILKKFGYDAHDIELAKIADICTISATPSTVPTMLSTAACLLMKFCVAAIFLRKTASRSSRPSPTTMNRRAARWTQSRRHSHRRQDRCPPQPGTPEAQGAFDIHDRVNYAVTDQTLKINTDKRVISLNLQLDTGICSMYEYFEIFLGRMLMCRGAAELLNATFKLTANGAKVL